MAELGAPPFACSHCDRRFQRPEHMRRHARTHTGARPFACSQCRATFARRDLLRRHENTIHSSDGKTRRRRPNTSLLAKSDGMTPTPGPVLGSDQEDIQNIVLPDHPVAPDIFENRGITIPTSTTDSLEDSAYLPNANPSPSNLFPPDLGLWDMINFNPPFTFPSLFDPPDPLAPDPISPDAPIDPPTLLPHPAATSAFPSPHGTSTLSPSNPAPGCNSNVQSLHDLTGLSRHAINRYYKGFLDGFARHLPFLHVPTFKMSDANPVLALAIISLGSQYAFEREISRRFWHKARELLTEFLIKDPDSHDLGITQAILILIVSGTWDVDLPLMDQAMSLQSVLATRIRRHGLHESTHPTSYPAEPLSWLEWIHAEEARRTKYTVFSFFNMQTNGFHTPPPLLASEIHLQLPSFQDEWEAPNEHVWVLIRSRYNPPGFQERLAELKPSASKSSSPFPTREKPTSEPESMNNNRAGLSEFANYVLITALLQNIYHLRQITSNQGRLPDFTEQARILKNWQSASDEPQLENRSPLLFNASALMRLAYIRLNVNFGPVRSALISTSREFATTRAADVLLRMQHVSRGEEALRAADYACGALSIPVRMGIDLCAHTQAFVWSLQHCICSFECALLLSSWMAVMLAVADEHRTIEERRVIGRVYAILREAGYEAFATERESCAQILRLWAKLFCGTCIWDFIPLMGETLKAVADRVETSETPFYPGA